MSYRPSGQDVLPIRPSETIRVRSYLFLLLVLLCVYPVCAQATPEAADIQKALTPPDIAVDGYELSHDDLVAFYNARENKPAWNFAGADNSTAFKAFLDSLNHLIDYHGLVPEDYPLDAMQKLAATNPANGIDLELMVTDTLLKLARDLHGDTVDMDSLYPGWNFHRDNADIPANLAAAVGADSLNDYIESLSPKNPAYGQLAQALQTYRALASHGAWPNVDPGPKLLPGEHGRRVEQIRARLTAEAYLGTPATPNPHPALYDDELKNAVIDYQKRNGLAADGHIGPKTVEAFNLSVTTRIDQIRANMERWRHMPESFPPSRYALVNIPDASITIMDSGVAVYRGLVIVGKVDRKTPFIQSIIRSMIFNPSWHVPTKIAQKDILPKLRKDPHYLEKLGFVIRDSEDDPYGQNIDWKSMPEREFTFRLRQSPGDKNSLGRLKFDFDNDFAVYMHGTPHQELFKKNERNLSSGCVRLSEPVRVAQIVLSGNKDAWPIERIQAEVDTNKTRWVAIGNPLPVYFLYWTVFTDEGGNVNFRNDAYDYDRFLIETMNPAPTAPRIAKDSEMPQKPLENIRD